MSRNTTDTIVSELLDSMKELAQHYSNHTADFEYVCLAGVTPKYVASIGFGDQAFRGSIMLLTDATSSIQIGNTVDSRIGDWLGELSNQLVGRFKNKISQYGRLINIGLPSIISGNDLLFLKDMAGCWRFKWCDSYLVAMLQLEILDEFDLVKSEESRTATEGECLLF